MGRTRLAQQFLLQVVIQILADRVGLAPTDTDGEPIPAGETQSIIADDVLLLTGYIQDKALFEQLGFELIADERKPRFSSTTMETNVAGVYVAGQRIAGGPNTTRRPQARMATLKEVDYSP